MSINLEKSVRNAKIVLDKIGFDKKVEVALALDISGSMSYVFSSGVVQELVERLLAIGINMDNNKEIEVYLFGQNAHFAGTATRENIDGFVKREIERRFRLEGSTLYAPVMKLISKEAGYSAGAVKESSGLLGRLFGSKTTEEPAADIETPRVVFFVTDGENFDGSQTESFIKEISSQPVFWQYIGINNSRFDFLEKLDDMGGRTIDNANFFNAGDIESISDDELYKRILGELPDWYKEAELKNIIK